MTEENTIAVPGGKYTYGHGKRKSASAKVRLYKGKGVITVNGKPVNEFFGTKDLANKLLEPLKSVGQKGNFDITIKVEGGGATGQAEAARHGIARALVELDPENRASLKKAGFLTRDSRKKERRKFGLKKARKAPQFSKR